MSEMRKLPSEMRYLPVTHCIKGSEGWQLNKKVQEALDSREYEKIYKPTFGATTLVEKYA